MAGLLIGAIGAGIGSLVGGSFLGVSAASWGWSAGVMLGNSLGPGMHSEGPRLGDLSVSASSYGQFAPYIWGTMRVGGNIIDASDKRETSKTTDQSGKGGPSITSTEYSYNADLAWDLCQSAVAIRKIWQNGKLTYDASVGSGSVEDQANAILGTGAQASGFHLYTGSESQLADPTLEAIHGVGEVPAYRGRAYVVAPALNLPGGQVPQMSFEISTAADTNTDQVLYCTAPVTGVVAGGNHGVICPDGTVFTFPKDEGEISQSSPGHTDFIGTIGNTFAWKTGGVFQTSTYWVPINGSGTDGEYPEAMCISGYQPNPPPPPGSDDPNEFRPVIYLLPIGAESGARQFMSFGFRDLDGVAATIPKYAAKDPVTKNYCFVVDSAAVRGVIIADSGDGSGGVHVTPNISAQSGTIINWGSQIAFYDQIIYVCRDVGDGINAEVCLYAGDEVVTYGGTDYTWGELIDTIPGPAGVSMFGQGTVMSANEHGVFVGMTNTSGGGGFLLAVGRIYEVKTSGWVLKSDDGGIPQLNGDDGTMYCHTHYAILGPTGDASGDNEYYIVPFATVDPDTVPVADVVTDICELSGLSSGQIDVSGVTAELDGYAITRQASGRSNIDPLLTAFMLDTCESDGKVFFVPRAGKSVVATIAFADLGAGESETPDRFPLTRIQESELPRSLTVNYINKDSDYQVGTERAERQVTTSTLDVTVDAPVAMDSDRAATLAETLLFDTWNNRNQRSTKVPRKYAALNPGDVVYVEYPEGTYTTKRITKANDTGAVVELSAVDYTGANYTRSVVGNGVVTNQTAPAAYTLTTPVVLDIPLLSDRDVDPGLYVAMSNQAQNFHGASLYATTFGADSAIAGVQLAGNTGGVDNVGSVEYSAVVGYSEDALGDWPYKMVDEANTVTVQLSGPGALDSITRALQLSGRSNYAAIGAPERWEIICFRVATDLGDGRYRLNGLLRGALGTEQFCDDHEVGDKFVLLQKPGMLRPPYSVSHIGQYLTFKAVTQGQSYAQAFATSALFSGVSTKPYSPVNLRCNRTATGHTITWNRRTRESQNFLKAIVPLAENSEAYFLQIDSDSSDGLHQAVVRDLTEYEYTSDAQTDNFGASDPTVNISIYQINYSNSTGGYNVTGYTATKVVTLQHW